MGSANITYSSTPDATRKRELTALASIYRRAIEKYEETQATGEDGGEDYKREELDDSRA